MQHSHRFYVRVNHYRLLKYTLHKNVKDIFQYLDLNAKIKANSQKCTKIQNFEYILNFFVVYMSSM